MINFDSDYMESCAPEILEKISSINLDKNSGYGTDIYCQSAKEKIEKPVVCQKMLKYSF